MFLFVLFAYNDVSFGLLYFYLYTDNYVVGQGS